MDRGVDWVSGGDERREKRVSDGGGWNRGGRLR